VDVEIDTAAGREAAGASTKAGENIEVAGRSVVVVLSRPSAR